MFFEDVPLVELKYLVFTRMPHDLGFCSVCVMSFKHLITPLCVDHILTTQNPF